MNNSSILWEGNSLFNNQSIVVIITALSQPSANSKTGNMLQSWILNQDDYPSNIVKENQDTSICGNCPLKGKICYVTMMAPNQIWRNYKEGNYSKLTTEHLTRIKKKRRLLRLGSYGDPCAVPFQIWQPLITNCLNYTGYTHAWQFTNQQWNQYLRASVESHSLKQKANSMGWKTFRITNDPSDILEDEVWCRNLEDNSTQCEDCRLCNAGKSKPNIVTLVHGNNYKVNNFFQLSYA